MAIIQLPQQQSFGGNLGKGLGAGISSGIQNLIDMKLQEIKNKKQSDTLAESLKLIFPEEKANAYAQLGAKNPQLLNTLLRVQEAMPAKKAVEKQSKSQKADKGFSKLKKMRKDAQLLMQKGNSMEDIMQSLKTSGIDDAEIEAIVSPVLNDNVVRFLLTKTNNNPEKAKRLAKKLGFKV